MYPAMCHAVLTGVNRLGTASSIAGYDDHGANAEACERRIGFSGRADRPLFRFTPGADAGCFHLSTRDHPTAAVDGSEQEFERQSAGGRGGKAAVGPKRPGISRVSRRSTAYGREYPMDDRFGKRIPGAAIGCDGRGPAHACEGSGHRKPKDQRATNCGNPDSLERQAGYRNRTSQP
jgi:hypothetical protein